MAGVDSSVVNSSDWCYNNHVEAKSSPFISGRMEAKVNASIDLINLCQWHKHAILARYYVNKVKKKVPNRGIIWQYLIQVWKEDCEALNSSFPTLLVEATRSLAMQSSVTEMPFDSESRWHRFHPGVHRHLPVHRILQFTFTSNLNAKFGHSHTKAWVWRLQTVKLQGRWTVVLLHSPKVNSQQQQHMFVYLQTGNLTHQSRHTVLAIKRVGCQLDECAERKYTQYVQCDPTLGLKMRKWHFSLSETVFYQLAVYFKEKGKCSQHP